MTLIKYKKILCNKIIKVLISFSAFILSCNIYAENINPSLKIGKIQVIGNSRIPDYRVLQLITLKEGMEIQQRDLDQELLISKILLKNEDLFLFTEIWYEVADTGVIITISLAENVIMMDFWAIPQGTFLRINSIRKGAPDLGAILGLKEQAAYIRIPSIMGSMLNFSTTMGREGRKIVDSNINPYNYENIFGRMTLQANFVSWFKVKIAGQANYNTKGISNIQNTLDFSTRVAGLIDFSYLKDIYMIGFDLNSQFIQGISKFNYSVVETGLNLYFHPINWDELILRGKYWNAFSGNIPDYMYSNIAGEYYVRGDIKYNYVDKKSIVFNVENWFKDIIIIPAKISKLHFNMLAFADFGIVYNDFSLTNKNSWNMSLGGAIEIFLSRPVNFTAEFGYGYEILHNSGGLFYFKIGTKFYKGNFYE